MSIRLHITAEGQTEERFVKEILAPFLGEKNVWADARCALTSKNNRLGTEYRGDGEGPGPTPRSKEISAPG